MKTLYEVLNVDLVNEYTKARKKAAVEDCGLPAELYSEVFEAINAMDIPEDDERMHWVQKLGRTAGVDLLTIGKVQPENMLAMASLPADDFKEAVKVATNSARNWNTLTQAAEKELNEETIPSTML
jgi:hypothetical protein|tara:strand:- start:268 stop:645 length:378 start_codon:yes stop_codon:yes gene_type:complete